MLAATTVIGLLASAAAQAVVEPGHWRFSQATGSYPGSKPNNFTVTVDQTPAGDYTGVFLNFDNPTKALTGLTYNVDEGADLFVVQAGTAFTKAWGDTHGSSFLMGPSVQRPNDPPPPAGVRSFPPRTIAVGTDFYLGTQTRSGSYSDFTVFGWAHFKVNGQGGIEMVDSAMAYGEAGIVIGQLTAVPEPATWGSFALGLAAIGGIRRRLKKA